MAPNAARRALARLISRARGSEAQGPDKRGRRARGGPTGPSAEAVSGPAASRRRRYQRATPPNVKGEGPLIADPGLGLAVVVIIRDEADYLEEWLCYHHALGVDHFFIYDNGSQDGLHELLERWINHGLVTLLHWPLPGGQIDAYNHALRFFGPSVDWMAFFDVDEFLVPLLDDDIPTALARFPDAADVRVPRREFGFSGHRSRPEGLAIEAYTGVADVFGRDPEKGARVKTVLQPRGIRAIGVHTATLADVPRARPGEPPGRPVPTRTVKGAAQGILQVNHYYTRSFEEFEAKRFRGSATGRIARPAIPFDLPVQEVDTSAHRFIERTRAMQERMRSLERKPYRYGSQLDLGRFPRSNDLGLFTEFALANLACGLEELQREPSIRLDNAWPGIGFLGDLAGTGFRPAPAGLSGSVHMTGLLEHIRGRIDASLPGPGAGPGAPRAGEHAPIRALRGSIGGLDGEAWPIALQDGSAELAIDIDTGGMRRCYALGLIAAPTATVCVEVRLEQADGDPTTPLVVELAKGGPFAAIVEIDDRPLLARRALLRVSSAAAEVRFQDLFLVSYG